MCVGAYFMSFFYRQGLTIAMKATKIWTLLKFPMIRYDTFDIVAQADSGSRAQDPPSARLDTPVCMTPIANLYLACTST